MFLRSGWGVGGEGLQKECHTAVLQEAKRLQKEAARAEAKEALAEAASGQDIANLEAGEGSHGKSREQPTLV